MPTATALLGPLDDCVGVINQTVHFSIFSMLSLEPPTPTTTINDDINDMHAICANTRVVEGISHTSSATAKLFFKRCTPFLHIDSEEKECKPSWHSNSQFLTDFLAWIFLGVCVPFLADLSLVMSLICVPTAH